MPDKMPVETIPSGKAGWLHRYRVVLSFVCGWVPVFVLGTIVLQFNIRHGETARLADHHDTTQGTFVQEAQSGHSEIYYSYSVDGRNHSGKGTYHGPRPILPDQSVLVYYLPENPGISMLIDPAVSLRDSLEMGVILPAWVGIMVWFMVFRFFQLLAEPLHRSVHFPSLVSPP